ncbi:MAG TPA: LptF/LptG family permease [Devosia sp.]|nr:LptF/LptG family permease [Devosia sp.]
MSRLSLYLLRLFSIEAMALFAVASFLLFLIQTLRLLDSVLARGQGILTLIGQSLLGIPTLGTAFLYICLGIGLGRALRSLQGSSELAVIHSSHLLPTLLRAIGLYILLGVLALLLIAHVIEPLSQRVSARWSANIAADLVGHSLVPHKFTELVPGVTISIASRSFGGEVRGFFADDRRTEGARRTYIASSALIGEDAQGYVLKLADGVVQYRSEEKEFSEFSFSRYDLALDRLTNATPADTQTLDQSTSLDLVASALSARRWSPDILQMLVRRSGEALRVAAMCVLVTALATFPSGSRRNGRIPIELIVLGVAFLERGFTAYAPIKGIYSTASGGLFLLVLGLVLLLFRLRIFQGLPRARPA